MVHLIDKDALVAEIEKKKEKYWKRGEESDALQDGNAKYWGGVLSCLNEISTLCDTLEVKEVDLDKEEERIWKDFNMAECHLSKNDLEKISKHFFELGMQVSNKAQKGE